MNLNDIESYIKKEFERRLLEYFNNNNPFFVTGNKSHKRGDITKKTDNIIYVEFENK